MLTFTSYKVHNEKLKLLIDSSIIFFWLMIMISILLNQNSQKYHNLSEIVKVLLQKQMLWWSIWKTLINKFNS